MACGQVKCLEPTCSTKLPACQMIRGKCPACNAKVDQPQQNQTNVLNQSIINRQQFKQ